MVDKTLVKTLVEAWGPSGYEYAVRTLIEARVRDLADEIRVDASGSLICRMGSGNKKIMIAAHMDEIGLMVSHIDRNGFGRFAPVGGLFPFTLVGGRVRFANGVIGVIGIEEPFEAVKSPHISDLFIDFSEEADNSGSVKVGDIGGMWREYAERGSRMISKSMDDRIGCVVAIETMRNLKADPAFAESGNEVYFAFTTQEEVGIRGARTAAFGIAPDYAIALDVTPANDAPKTDPNPILLSKGAAIKVMDVGHIVPPAFKELLIARAEAANIPYQLEILTRGTTDAAAIQLSTAGIPSAAISIPCRFVHSVSETVDARDVDACVDLLTEVLKQPLTGLEM